MNITLFVTKRCNSCNRVRARLEKKITERKELKLYIEDIKAVSSKGIVFIPALFIEDELYAYGDIDEEKFLERLQIHLSSD
jgi:predicted thioredoxin/glutaredoxin